MMSKMVPSMDAQRGRMITVPAISSFERIAGKAGQVGWLIVFDTQPGEGELISFPNYWPARWLWLKLKLAGAHVRWLGYGDAEALMNGALVDESAP